MVAKVTAENTATTGSIETVDTMETNNTLLSSLESKGQVELLNDIDQLRSQGLGHFEVSLPQIIVCGDQSSGKSSVLEALSRVQFPTKDELCTRFATEVILRKAPTARASVAIIPGISRSDGERQRLLSFKSPHSSLEQFSALVEAAQTEILSARASAFSDDVLRVEICGPNLPQLTIVDLPGIIHSESQQQTDADVKLVSKLVRGYMENQRSIILTVVTAKNDISNQIVLKMAREVDPNGSRTLGVITKPDTLHAGSNSELKFVELAKNENIKFHLGWHVVRNRDFDTKDIPSEARDEAESRFLAEGIWKSLPRNIVGIDSLRGRLSRVLLEHITRELPALIEYIERGLQDCRTRLSSLGESRTSLKEQRLFLIRTSQRFQSITKAAVDGDYSDSFFNHTDEGYSKRLRAVIQNLNTEFSALMTTKGHRLEIMKDNDNKTDLDESSELKTDFLASMGGEPKKVSWSTYLSMVRSMMRKNRGRELPGTFNPLLISDLFFNQAEPWQQLAQEHVQQTWEASKTTLELALSTIVDEETNAALQAQVVYPIMREKLSELNKRLEQIIKPHRKGHAITYNHYFTEVIQKARLERQEKDLSQRFYSYFGVREHDPPDEIDIKAKVSVPKLISSLTNQSEADMDLYACSELVECMQAYYKVALKVFIDNVASLAIENCLMEGLQDILSPSHIMDMDDSLVTAIAAEPEEAQNERHLLTEKQKVLEAGLQTCKRYVRRRTAGIQKVKPLLSFGSPTLAKPETNTSILGVPTSKTRDPDIKAEPLSKPLSADVKKASTPPSHRGTLFSAPGTTPASFPPSSNAASGFGITDQTKASKTESFFNNPSSLFTHPVFGIPATPTPKASSPSTQPFAMPTWGGTVGGNGDTNSGVNRNTSPFAQLASTTSVFGGNAGNKGNTKSGSSDANRSPFGQGFPSASSKPAFPTKNPGSLYADLEPLTEREVTLSNGLIQIACISQYFRAPLRDFSFEEVRLEDYSQGRRFAPPNV